MVICKEGNQFFCLQPLLPSFVKKNNHPNTFQLQTSTFLRIAKILLITSSSCTHLAQLLLRGGDGNQVQLKIRLPPPPPTPNSFNYFHINLLYFYIYLLLFIHHSRQIYEKVVFINFLKKKKSYELFGAITVPTYNKIINNT